MGDFVGGMLKYVRDHPVDRVTVAGGFAKMSKLGQGLLDLHSRRGEVSFDWLAARMAESGGSEQLAEAVRRADSAAEALSLSAAQHIDLAGAVAARALETAKEALVDAPVAVDIVVVDREGNIIGRAG
jgi:cobalt-precorrin-5B (C1)-methyltransferase